MLRYKIFRGHIRLRCHITIIKFISGTVVYIIKYRRTEKEQNKTKHKTRQPVPIFPTSRSRIPHFWCMHPGGYDPHIRTRPRFLYLPKFHHPMFTHSEVILLINTPTHPQANKQTPLETSNALRYATTLGKNTQK